MTELKKIITVALVVTFASGILFADVYSLSGVSASAKVKNQIKNDILKWINSSVIVNEVKKANKKNANRSMATIKEQDNKWKKSRRISSFMKYFITNKAARFLKRRQRASKGKYSEIFVMDYQGCNVAMSRKTSDYWQGDEAKFKKSYGRKAIFADKAKYDKSTRTTTIQVSLPIVDGGKVIGAITVGIEVDNL